MSTEKETKSYLITHDNIFYTFRFNASKMEAYESTHGAAFAAVVRSNGGVLPLSHLRTLFVLSLVDSKSGEPVEQRRATEIFDDVLKDKGALSLGGVLTDKIAVDMPFLFQ